MLKNIDPLLTPDLLYILRAMGHGDEIVIVDANYPAESAGPQVVRLDALNATQALDLVLSVMPLDTVVGTTRGRVQLVDAGRDDDVETLLAARTVVAVGTGVAPEEYGELDPLLKVLGAELGASRKVTDKGWLPRARQIGITGHSIAPAWAVRLVSPTPCASSL